MRGSGATIIKGDKPGKVTIIPSQRKVSVGVTNGGVKIGDANFDVKNVPAPRFVAYIGNTEVDLRNGIRANQIASFVLSRSLKTTLNRKSPKMLAIESNVQK